MKKISLLVFILNLIFVSLSCTRHEQPTVEDQFQKIQQRIDRKEYAEAEAEVQAILASEPHNERARVILASISVSKAGVTLKDYFLLEKISHFEENPSVSVIPMESLEKLKIPGATELGKGLQFLKQVNLVAGRFQEIIQKFEQIPSVSFEGSFHLQNALKELEKLDRPLDGNALYRGVIKLLYFKYLLQNGWFLEFGDRKFCSQTVADLELKLSEYDLFTVGMVRDIGRGFPKNQVEFEKQASQLENGFKEAKKFLNGIQKASMTVEQTLTELAVSQQVEGLKCEF